MITSELPVSTLPRATTSNVPSAYQPVTVTSTTGAEAGIMQYELPRVLQEATQLAVTEVAMIAAYVDSVRQLDSVRKIITERTFDRPMRVYTLISAPRFESAARRPFHEAEIAALSLGEQPIVQFELINENELDSQLDAVLPVEGRVWLQK